MYNNTMGAIKRCCKRFINVFAFKNEIIHLSDYNTILYIRQFKCTFNLLENFN